MPEGADEASVAAAAAAVEVEEFVVDMKAAEAIKSEVEAKGKEGDDDEPAPEPEPEAAEPEPDMEDMSDVGVLAERFAKACGVPDNKGPSPRRPLPSSSQHTSTCAQKDSRRTKKEEVCCVFCVCFVRAVSPPKA